MKKVAADLMSRLQTSSGARQLLTHLPKALLLPFAKLPGCVQQSVIKKVLSQVLKPSLELGELDFLNRNYLEVVITDVALTFYISVEEANLIVQSERPLGGNVSFQGNSNYMLLMMSREIDPDTLFFQRKLLMTGDTELGLEIKNFLDDFDMTQVPKVVNSALQQYGKLAAAPGA